MPQPFAHLRLRLFAVLLFSVAGFLPVLGTSAQSESSFALTGVEFLCGTETSVSPRVIMHYSFAGEIASASASVHNTSTNYSASMDLNLGSSGDGEIQLPDGTEKLDTLFLRVVMSGEFPRVYEYTVQLGSCGGATYAITGGQVGDDTDSPDFPIVIDNLTCTGFDWSVSAPYEVLVYVSVMDTIGQGMIPYVPVNGTDLSRTETFEVSNENQTNFNVLITVHDIDTDQELARKSMSRHCPLVTETPEVSPTVIPSVTPDVDDQEERTTTIQVQMPNGESIVGAPWDLFAPSASMQAGVAPLQSGVVGANNTITVHGLVEGQYRLLISPTGMDAIDFTFAVGPGLVTELLAIVNADGSVTVQAAQPVVTQTPEASSGQASSTESAESAASVSGLPSTGIGQTATGIPATLFAFVAVLTGVVSLIGVRHSNKGSR